MRPPPLRAAIGAWRLRVRAGQLSRWGEPPSARAAAADALGRLRPAAAERPVELRDRAQLLAAAPARAGAPGRTAAGRRSAPRGSSTRPAS
ncbi:MAG: hypothetical protein MZU97_09405 [Bacillus subtilis]|nr:hypothetical protein [Bacillus subtilis]